MNAHTASCPKPRRAEKARGAILVAFGLSLGLAGCDGIVLPPEEGCPNLTELCPDLVCATGHETDAEGCLICQCKDDEPEPTVCWEDSECGDGQRCDSVNFCETPPGCTDDQPCPAVCYGRCVDDAVGCTSDADCGEGQACRYGQAVNSPEARPSDEQGDAAMPCEPGTDCDPPQETGVCVPVECAGDRMAYPACPPGTEPVIDFTTDPCGNVQCIPVDDCRALSPDQCELVEGCHLEEYGSGGCGDCGAGMDCLCEPVTEVICVPDQTDCYNLDEEACLQNPECVPEYYISDCAAPPPDCESDPSCLWECDPAQGFVCLPRDTDPSCFSDFDCAPGERCSYETECYDVCTSSPNGESYCYTECYGNTGVCIPDETSCYDLPLDLCEQDPRCMIEGSNGETPDAAPCFCDPATGEGCDNCGGGSLCVPRPTPICYSDADCGYGQVCALESYCPPCADGDFACGMPCFVEGVCVDVGPGSCSDGSACPPGHTCESVVVCSACGSTGSDENGLMPPEDCAEICWEEVTCVPVQTNDYCYSNQDCAEGTQCNMDVCMSDPNCPNCDVCVGVCEPVPGEVCFIDADCGTGICNTWDYCEVPGGTPPNGLIACMGRCEELPPPPSACLADGDCAQGERCATELDICYCPDNVCTMEAPCYSMCVPADPTEVQCFIDEDCGADAKCLDGICTFNGECAQVITAAIGPDGQCFEFPTPCDVPADFQIVESCQP
jgi:hypothetical protein